MGRYKGMGANYLHQGIFCFPWDRFLVVLFFGGKRLPELGKGLGEGLKGFKDGMKGVTGDDKPADTAHNVTPKPEESIKS